MQADRAGHGIASNHPDGKLVGGWTQPDGAGRARRGRLAQAGFSDRRKTDRIEEAQPVSSDSSHQSTRFEESQHAASHLAAGSNDAREVRTSEDGWLREEEITVLMQHPCHPPERILVDQPVEAPDDLLEALEDVVEDVDGEARIDGGQ
jgi:hypothetical protein